MNLVLRRTATAVRAALRSCPRNKIIIDYPTQSKGFLLTRLSKQYQNIIPVVPRVAEVSKIGSL